MTMKNGMYVQNVGKKRTIAMKLSNVGVYFPHQYVVQKNGKTRLRPVTYYHWTATPHKLVWSYTEGEYQKITLTRFDAGSRHKIRHWLKTMYDFEFKTYTEKLTPKVDGDELEALGEYGADLRRYLKVVKDLSQIRGLIEATREDSTVTSRIDTNGTITGRFTSSNVNLNQIPKQPEFRSLFTAPEGWTFVGVDFDQQELVNLGHYLFPYDNGQYADTVANGKKEDETDIHNVNKRMAGLDSRDAAKIFGFQFLYGAGAVKNGDSLLKELLTDYTEEEYIYAKDKVLGRSMNINGEAYFPIGKDVYVLVDELLIHKAIYGERVMEKFTTNTPGLKELIAQLTKDSENGYITVPGGRILSIRHKHAALNTHLQGLGGQAMKVYLVTIHKLLREAGLQHGTDFIQQATIYDEVDMIVKDEHVETVKAILEKAFPLVSFKLGLNNSYSGGAMSGKNWAVCH